MTKQASVVLAALIGMAGFGEARADPFTYTETATASGSLGATRFTDAFVTLTATADTSQIMTGQRFFQVNNLTTTVSVSGLGTAAFTNRTQTFNDQSFPGAGITDLVDILDVDNPALATYDLRTSIGPLTGVTVGFNPGTHFATTSGDFVLNSVSGSTFQATAQPAPEPSTLALFGLGAAALAGWRWRKHPRAAA
jgi:hypothetical protein